MMSCLRPVSCSGWGDSQSKRVAHVQAGCQGWTFLSRRSSVRGGEHKTSTLSVGEEAECMTETTVFDQNESSHEGCSRLPSQA